MVASIAAYYARTGGVALTKMEARHAIRRVSR
jgi:hypothetical protein